MKLTSIPLAIAMLVIFFGGIVVTSNLGWFQTTTNKVPATFKEGEFAGQYNPADIRGSYTFGDVSSLFGVPLDVLKAAFLVPADKDTASYQVKNLETQFADSGYEIGTGSIRLFTALYGGLPYDLSEDTYLPKEAAAILQQRGKLSTEQAKYVEAHTVDLSKPAAQPTPQAAAGTPAPQAAATPQATVSATVHVQTDKTITGKTTFQDLLNWGVSKEAIEKALGGTMPSASMIIKDYLATKNLEFSTYKGILQAEVDKVK